MLRTAGTEVSLVSGSADGSCAVPVPLSGCPVGQLVREGTVGVVSADGTRIEEQAAAEVICAVEDVVSWERLKRRGSVPTPDFRFQLADRRVADVEVTMHTDGAARSFRHQLSEERDGKGKARNGRHRRVWNFSDLSYLWTVVISDPAPAKNARQSVRRYVNDLKNLFEQIEPTSADPFQLRRHAQFELDVRLLQALDDIETIDDRTAFVWGYPEYRGLGKGAIKTLGSTGEPELGDIDSLRRAVDACTRRKIAGSQLDDAPGERWLVVMLGQSAACSQLNEHIGPGASEPFPDLSDLMHDYLDETWIVAEAPPPAAYLAVRLIKSARLQVRRLIPAPAVELGATLEAG